MPSFRDFTGQRLGRLIPVSFEKKGNRIYWLCQCDCGNTKYINSRALGRREGPTRSCGCINSGFKSFSPIKRRINYKHGQTIGGIRSSTYKSWQDMKARCYNENNKKYPDYGGRGISVCDRWLESFNNFFEDMGTKPKSFELDRVNNNSGYFPENCQWASRRDQVNNRRNTLIVMYNGENMPLSKAVRLSGINYWSAYSRAKDGCPIDKTRQRRPHK